MQHSVTLFIVTISLVKLLDVNSLRVPENLDDLIQSGAKIAYIKSYSNGDDGDNEKGYHKTSNDKGADGYKHFDSFHKTDSDKYGYETHSAFGKAAGYDADAGGKSKHSQNDHQRRRDYEDEQDNDKEIQEKDTKNAYKVVDNEGDSNDYAEGNDATVGYAGKYSSGDGDSRSYDSGTEPYSFRNPAGHYETDGDVDERESGNYESQGNEDENSAYKSDADKSDEEHYTEDGGDTEY